MRSLDSSRLRVALGPLLAIVLVNSCTTELAPSSVVTVTLQQTTPWPDTLSTGDLATLQASVKGSDGADIVGVDLQWSSSDSSVLQVAHPDARTAIVATHATGTASIIARFDRDGFTSAELRVPIVVKPGTWPALLTVGSQDTVGVGLWYTDPAILGPVSYSWQSSDPAVLQTNPLATDSAFAQLTARASGAADVTLAVTGPRIGRVEFRQGLAVGNVQIAAQPAWPALLPVTETTQLAVTVKDAAGNPFPGAHVNWSSTNLSAFTVDSTGAVTALSRGSGEVVASVGTPPFQVAELRAPLVVVELWGAVSAGGAHTCAITATDGTGFCWGDNGTGQLGLAVDASPFKTRPSRIVTFHRFTDIQSGASHSCGREGVDNLLCWGLRDRAQLGDGLCPPNATDFSIICTPFSSVPVTIVAAGVLNGQQVAVNAIAAGRTLSCMVNGLHIRSSTLDPVGFCWGNVNGVGNVSPLPPFDSTAALAQAQSFPESQVITAGGSQACVYNPHAFSGTQEVQCAGLNASGQLGDGTTTDRSTYSDVLRFDAPNKGMNQGLVGASAGARHTCALLVDAVWCWGSNSSGQLGAAAASTCGPSDWIPTGSEPCSLFAIPAALPVSAVSVSAGGEHTCALTATGDAWCWGSNSNGQLGRGTVGGSSQTPQIVSGGLTFLSISAGGNHTCGVTVAHSIYCWGANGRGQLGDGSQTDRGAPVRVAEAPL